jgi:hypothetical protein
MTEETNDKKLYLLREFAEFDYTKELDDAGSPKKSKYGNMMVKGILQRANTLNQNGRVYPKDILEREINNYMKLVKERRATGELDHADEPVVNLKTVSHVITDVWWEGDIVWGRVEILEDMDQGRQLKTLFNNGIKVGISSRAVGSVKQQQNTAVVQDDLQLICWDFVSEPSTPGAFMMREARELTREQKKEVDNFLKKSDRIDRIVNEILGIRKL